MYRATNLKGDKKMFHKIKNVEALPNLILKIKFENNEIKYYYMENIIEEFKQ